MDPTLVQVLGQVETEKKNAQATTSTKKKTTSSKEAIKKKSSKTSSDDLNELDNKWSQEVCQTGGYVIGQDFLCSG